MGNFGTMSRDEIKKRHQEKIILIMGWLASYSFSTLAILSRLLEIDERNTRLTLQKLISENLINSEILPSGHRVFGISRSGIDYLENIDSWLSKIACPYRLCHTAISTLAHQINVQLIQLNLQAKGWHDFVPGRELYKMGALQVPDLAALDQYSVMTAVECELNLKSVRRFKIICSNYCEMIDEVPDPCVWFQRVLYLTPFPERLSKMLNAFVPDEKRNLFQVVRLQVAPLSLTPRHRHDGGE